MLCFTSLKMLFHGLLVEIDSNLKMSSWKSMMKIISAAQKKNIWASITSCKHNIDELSPCQFDWLTNTSSTNRASLAFIQSYLKGNAELVIILIILSLRATPFMSDIAIWPTVDIQILISATWTGIFLITIQFFLHMNQFISFSQQYLTTNFLLPLKLSLSFNRRYYLIQRETCILTTFSY